MATNARTSPASHSGRRRAIHPAAVAFAVTLAVIAASGRPARAADVARLCPGAKTTLAIETCLAHADARADHDLGATIAGIRKREPASAARLAAVQTRWRAFRQADCEMDSDRYAGGTLVPIAYAACLETRTRRRIVDLVTMFADR